jgi:hypothetical protein
MPRAHSSVVVLCVAIVALAPFVTGGLLDYALLEVQWILVGDLTTGTVHPPEPFPDEQRLSLRSILPSRAPPSLAL